MGTCLSSKKQTRNTLQLSKHTSSTHFFKAKSSSKKVICFKPEDTTFWEINVQTELMFQPGALSCRISASKLMFVGGIENGETAFTLDLQECKTDTIPSPPVGLVYGQLHILGSRVYVVGALTIEQSGQEKPAPLLYYDLRRKHWELIERPPAEVALTGGFIQDNFLYLLGGFLNYPEAPVPFQGVLSYDTLSGRWGRSAVTCPVNQGLPVCVPLASKAILVVGGHDPCEHYGEESDSVYLFTGQEFFEYPSLPGEGQLRFSDPSLQIESQVLLFSEDEVLFRFDLNSQEWSCLDSEEKLQENFQVPFLPQKPHNSVYHYKQQECEILEYNIETKRTKKTGPSSFQYFLKHTGICLLDDGRLMFAGGIKEGEKEGTKTVWMLDPELKLSNNAADLPSCQYALRLVPVGHDVYAVAGYQDGQSKCQKYSMVHNSWEKLPDMSMPTLFPGCCHLLGRIFCIGGYVEEAGSPNLYLIQTYTVDQCRWDLLTLEYPIGVSGLGVVALASNKILCFGGRVMDGSKVNKSYLLEGEHFTALPDLPETDVKSDSTVFIDPPIVKESDAYAFSKNGYLYRFECNTLTWHLEYPNILNRA